MLTERYGEKEASRVLCRTLGAAVEYGKEPVAEAQHVRTRTVVKECLFTRVRRIGILGRSCEPSFLPPLATSYPLLYNQIRFGR
jgi:hypothetical protein